MSSFSILLISFLLVLFTFKIQATSSNPAPPAYRKYKLLYSVTEPGRMATYVNVTMDVDARKVLLEFTAGNEKTFVYAEGYDSHVEYWGRTVSTSPYGTQPSVSCTYDPNFYYWHPLDWNVIAGVSSCQNYLGMKTLSSGNYDVWSCSHSQYPLLFCSYNANECSKVSLQTTNDANSHEQSSNYGLTTLQTFEQFTFFTGEYIGDITFDKRDCYRMSKEGSHGFNSPASHLNRIVKKIQKESDHSKKE